MASYMSKSVDGANIQDIQVELTEEESDDLLLKFPLVDFMPSQRSDKMVGYSLCSGGMAYYLLHSHVL